MYKSGEVSVRPCGADGDVARDSAETNGSSGGREANSRREDAAIELVILLDSGERRGSFIVNTM